MGALLNLPDRLDNGAAADLLKAFQDHQGTCLDVNAQSVTQLGTLSAQVLVAAIQSWSTTEKSLHFQSISPELQSAWSDLGLSDIEFPTREGGQV